MGGGEENGVEGCVSEEGREGGLGGGAVRNCVRNERDDNGWMEDCRVDTSRARLTEVRIEGGRCDVESCVLLRLIVWSRVVKDGGDDVGGDAGVVGLVSEEAVLVQNLRVTVCVFTE